MTVARLAMHRAFDLADETCDLVNTFSVALWEP